jgi:hypothetical protein
MDAPIETEQGRSWIPSLGIPTPNRRSGAPQIGPALCPMCPPKQWTSGTALTSPCTPVHPCITSLGPTLLLQTPSAHDVGPVPAVPEVDVRDILVCSGSVEPKRAAKMKPSSRHFRGACERIKPSLVQRHPVFISQKILSCLDAAPREVSINSSYSTGGGHRRVGWCQSHPGSR